MSGFGKDIAQWASDAQNEIVEEPALFVNRLFKSVIDFSPVLTSNFVANWHVAGDSIPSQQLFNARSTKTSKKTDVDSVITLDFFLRHKYAVIVNNTHYSKQVEEEGWRRTGPYAPVANAIAKHGNEV